MSEVLALLGLSGQQVRQVLKDPKVILGQSGHPDLMALKVRRVCPDPLAPKVIRDRLGPKAIRVIQGRQVQQALKAQPVQQVPQEPLGHKAFRARLEQQVRRVQKVTRVTKVTLAQVSPLKAVCPTQAASQMISAQTMREVGGSRKMMGTCGFGMVTLG